LKSIKRGAELTSQLLTFAREQQLEPRPLVVSQLVNDMEDMLRRSLGPLVRLKTQSGAPEATVYADATQLEMAILNLAINARDAMPEGGSLTIASHARRIDQHPSLEPGDYVELMVVDTGVGMPAEVVARAFDPFFTTKGVGKGTGLGLSQVYGFAKQSGGFVAVDSAPGQGTKMMIYLPRTDPAETVPEQPWVPVTHPDGRGVVLLVEDDIGVRATTRALFNDLGYEVVEAANARAALAIIDGDDPITLVFTDVIMPGGMNGVELANEITQRQPDLPVLLTSGYTAQRLIPDSVTRAWPILRKPYTQADLSQAVNETLNHAPE
jgi:CheY-like chemotaxis protein